MTVVYATIVSFTLALKRVSFDDRRSHPYICLQDYTEFARDLEIAPDGYQSCHGVKNRPDVNPTPFEEDEFVVYSVSQQKIRYLVEFSLPGDDVKIDDAGDVITSSEG